MKPFTVLMATTLCVAPVIYAKPKPNVVLIYADDISAREIPFYGSSVWTDADRQTTKDLASRAKTPVLDRLSTEGAWIKHAWAATVCSPSRAMMMTGRHASIHKWWNNGDLGTIVRDGKKTKEVVPLYQTSPLLIGHIAQKAGYATQWTGKTQMKRCDHQLFGFDEGVFTPGSYLFPENPHTDFVLKGPTNALINIDTGKKVDYYAQTSWYWKPSVALMNHPTGRTPIDYWPILEEDKKNYGINTYGPDVELDFIFDFMERKHDEEKPFFIYHTTHLGHDGFDWFNPEENTCWPSTPIIEWDGTSYTRKEPNVTGDKGIYHLNNSVTEPGMHSHVEYLDYQVWQYLEKFKEMGIEDHTVFIFCADNGTSKYGKGSPDRQKGTHVPFLIYAPGFKLMKQGEQDVLASVVDIMPTLADIMDFKIPKDYEIHGKSLWPYLTGDATVHREWIYAYRSEMQLIRGDKVMKDGRNKWWDVAETPDDLISFREIKDWTSVSPEHRAQRDLLKSVLPQYDNHAEEHDFIIK